MNVLLIIEIVLVAVALFFLIKILRKLLKVFFIVVILLLVVIAGASYLVWRDISDIRQHMSNSTNLMLLDTAGSIVAGYTTEGFSLPLRSALTAPEVQQLDSSYRKGMLNTMLGAHYKLFIVNSTLLPELSKTPTAAEFAAAVDGHGLVFLYAGYGKRAVRIYPETLFFRLAKPIPSYLSGRIDAFQAKVAQKLNLSAQPQQGG